MNLKPVKKGFHLNPIAQLYIMSLNLVKVLIAGRGFGKSFINGISILIKVWKLPKSKGLFLGATYTQIWTNTLLPIKSAWAWFGYVEGVHYVIGIRPPKYFDDPFMKPGNYKNVITFWNGTTVIMASMDRPELNRGGNNDWCITDEALLVKKDDYDRNIAPSIRGSHTSLKGKQGHLSEEFTSSMPFGSIGTWLLDKKKASRDPENDTFYIEGTSWHNRKVLGDEVLKKWKREMSPIIYLIEVMNYRIRQFGDVFYPSLKEKHWYSDSDNFDYIDTLGVELKAEERDCRWDKDYNREKPINISHDWGAFNCITIDQAYPVELRFINAMHVTHPDIIDDLANNFCDYYHYHHENHKYIYQYGDKSGNKREGNAKLSNFEQFAAVLRKRGWNVQRMKTGDVNHLERHTFINKVHREEDSRLPKVRHNLLRCKNLRISLESAAMKGTQKDKSSENLKSGVAPEHATHYSDAYDYRIWHGYHHKIEEATYTSPVDIR
ncbi:hypothetical protein GBO34_00790 [Roseivirga pacifica]|uniref:hypothetical protein n=1 Tax=Roseivirga pacifica TaxID=1267423 RepID=UPI0020962D80|nr:hypothetical protein [Roseivirga pacifica]MCO6367849.1 hypothetical protein [Roseivirga pacifica]MCO6377221.1 hypothetical protein [Roseivirga pacifica]